MEKGSLHYGSSDRSVGNVSSRLLPESGSRTGLFGSISLPNSGFEPDEGKRRKFFLGAVARFSKVGFVVVGEVTTSHIVDVVLDGPCDLS